MAFDKKKKNMPDITTYTTEQLLTMLSSYLQAPNENTVYQELLGRKIKESDPETDSTYQTKGGIRPYHAPHVPA